MKGEIMRSRFKDALEALILFLLLLAGAGFVGTMDRAQELEELRWHRIENGLDPETGR
jgi:hypothetical protein